MGVCPLGDMLALRAAVCIREPEMIPLKDAGFFHFVTNPELGVQANVILGRVRVRRGDLKFHLVGIEEHMARIDDPLKLFAPDV